MKQSAHCESAMIRHRSVGLLSVRGEKKSLQFPSEECREYRGGKRLTVYLVR